MKATGEITRIVLDPEEMRVEREAVVIYTSPFFHSDIAQVAKYHRCLEERHEKYPQMRLDCDVLLALFALGNGREERRPESEVPPY